MADRESMRLTLGGGVSCAFTHGPSGASAADLTITSASGGLDLALWHVQWQSLHTDLLGLTQRDSTIVGLPVGLELKVDVTVGSLYGTLTGRYLVHRGAISLDGTDAASHSPPDLKIATEYRRMVALSFGQGWLDSLLGPYGTVDGDVAALSAFVGLVASLEHKGTGFEGLGDALAQAEECYPSHHQIGTG